MAAQKGDLKDRLSRYSEIDLSVTGRKSGRTISQPVWFVWDDDRLYLLPVRGSDTQWYKNVLKNPAIRVDARGAEAEFHDYYCRRSRCPNNETLSEKAEEAGRESLG